MSLFGGGLVTSRPIENLLDLLARGGRGFINPVLTLVSNPPLQAMNGHLEGVPQPQVLGTYDHHSS